MMSTIRVTFKTVRGEDFAVEAPVGSTLMQAAVRNNNPGIEAECGGSCICTPCHAYCGEGAAVIGKAGPEEDEMLEQATAERRETSRLSCRIRLTPAIDGSVFCVPETQC
jgi:2Fe-2S ferredoxin